MSTGPASVTPTATTRAAAARSSAPILTGVRTSSLRTGDLVLTAEGLHVRLGARREHPRTDVPGDLVTAFAGTVENAHEVVIDGRVPAICLRRSAADGVSVEAPDSWGVQGNDLRTWSLLERGPRPTD